MDYSPFPFPSISSPFQFVAQRPVSGSRTAAYNSLEPNYSSGSKPLAPLPSDQLTSGALVPAQSSTKSKRGMAGITWCFADASEQEGANVYRSEFLSEPFRLMDLPAELQALILEFSLRPGMISLQSCSHHMHYRTAPKLAVGLLATCRQINEEAKELLLENWIVAIFSRAHLSEIKSLTLVVSVVEQILLGSGDYQPLQALTSLKHLSITIIARRRFRQSIEFLADILEEITVRVPVCCNIEYTCVTEEEREHVGAIVHRWRAREERSKETCHQQLPHSTHDIAKLDDEVVLEAARTVPQSVPQGTLSGVARKKVGVFAFDAVD